MQDPQPKTTLADLVTAALAQPGVTDEVHLASSLDREPQRVCPESRVHDREATCSDDGGLAQSLRSPELRAHKQASDTARSPARCRGVRQPWQKPASARPIRLPPHLTLAEASSVGLVQSRTAKIPTASVLESSAVRQKRLCRRGPSTPHRRDREEACSPALHEAKHERQAGESAADGFPRHRKPFQSGPVKPVTPEPRMPRSKKLQVESATISEGFAALARGGVQCVPDTQDYTQATESWIARRRGCLLNFRASRPIGVMLRIPSDDTLQERRQQRNRIASQLVLDRQLQTIALPDRNSKVVANRITSREWGT